MYWTEVQAWQNGWNIDWGENRKGELHCIVTRQTAVREDKRHLAQAQSQHRVKMPSPWLPRNHPVLQPLSNPDLPYTESTIALGPLVLRRGSQRIAGVHRRPSYTCEYWRGYLDRSLDSIIGRGVSPDVVWDILLEREGWPAWNSAGVSELSGVLYEVEIDEAGWDYYWFCGQL